MTAELAALAPFLIVGASAVLVGAAFGYYAASKDLKEERRKASALAWTRGAFDNAAARYTNSPIPNPYEMKDNHR